jgi:hypothetical protein
MAATVSHREIVIENIKKVANEQNCSLSSLSDNLLLQESGLDSLCWAIVVARLEERLGFDPFTARDDVLFPVTLGDFIRAYDSAATK